MNLLQPSFTIEERDEQRGGLNIIVRAGETCYKSEDSVVDPEQFARRLMERGHNSVLEHGDMLFEIDDPHIYDNVVETLQHIRDCGGQPPMLEMTRIDGRCIVSGNIRAWRELFDLGSLAGRYFIGHFDPLWVKGYGFEQEGADADPRVRQIHYSDLRGVGEKYAHLRQTVRFIVDRGVSHEFVRHRSMSFSQESTRYCNYAADRFGKNVSCIEPCFLKRGSEGYNLWRRAVMSAEVSYFALLNYGLSPQEARSVLDNSTKTELVMTGNLRAWDHFFDLRARQTSGNAHPQAVEVAMPLLERDKELYPDVFG